MSKFINNNVDVLRVIQNGLRMDGMKDKNLKLRKFAGNKSLEVKWSVKDDTLGFIIKMNDKPATQ